MPLIDVKPVKPPDRWAEVQPRVLVYSVAKRAARSRLLPLPPKLRIALGGFARLGYPLDLQRPCTFNERLIWLLLNTVDQRRSLLADKLAVKDYVAQRAPWVRTAEVFTSAARGSDLRLDALPDISVFKANNDSGGVKVLVKPFDPRKVVALADAWLERDPLRSKPAWERHYRDIPPRVFVESFLGADPQRRVDDYRFFVFSGRVAVITIRVIDEAGRKHRMVLDREWGYLPVGHRKQPGTPFVVPDPSLVPPRPAQLSDMVRAAEALADDLPFVRADLYLEEGRVCFGELTFSPNAGYTQWPRATNLELGALLRLPGGR